MIDVFTPSQTKCTKGVNAPGFESTKLNKAGVKTENQQDLMKTRGNRGELEGTEKN